VDGREGLAHVAGVRRSVARLAVVGVDGEPDPLQVLPEQVEDGEVRLERVVDDRVEGHLDPAARGGRRPLGRGLEAAPQLLEIALVEGAEVELGRRVFRDDVRLLAADRDDAVNAGVGPDLLAQGVEGVEQADDRVQRVDPAPGPGRRVGRLAEVLDLRLGEPQRRTPELGAAPRVDHHRDVDVAEDPALQQANLSRAALLGGRADDHHAPGERKPGPTRDLRQRRAGAGPGRGDDVVSARVADVRERVVLGHDRHRRPRPGAGHLGPEGGGDAAHAALDAAAPGLEEPGQPGGGLLLLVAELRVGVDLERERPELRIETVHGVHGAGLEAVEVGHGVSVRRSNRRGVVGERPIR
jgi:hypothetical protein